MIAFRLTKCAASVRRGRCQFGSLSPMRNPGIPILIAVVALVVEGVTSVRAQEPEPATRPAAIEQQQSEKAKDLQPYVPSKSEALLNKFEAVLTNGVPKWHPFLDSAYSGGGFTLGLGYLHFV